MKRLQEGLVKENQTSTLSFTDNITPATSRSIPSISSSTGNSTPRPSDAYNYGVDIVTGLATGPFVFFAKERTMALAGLLWRSISKRLCSLQEINEPVKDCFDA